MTRSIGERRQETHTPSETGMLKGSCPMGDDRITGSDLDSASSEEDGSVPTSSGVARSTPTSPARALSAHEIAMLSDVLAHLERDGAIVLSKLANLLRHALDAPGVMLALDGSTATSGSAVCEPHLEEPIVSEERSKEGREERWGERHEKKRRERTVGRIVVGRRSPPYGSDEVAKLGHYARLIGHLWATARAQRQYRQEAMTDEVTGLYNRRYLRRSLGRLLARAARERFRLTVLVFDIDNFKSYNDTYGHSAGDEVLCRIGQLFRAHSREHDVVTRYGGDEFCVVFWDADQPRRKGSDHPSDAMTVLHRFKEALKSCQYDSLGAEAKGCLTISGGLASFPVDATTAPELLAKADQALLQAKHAGKNQVFVFGEETPCHP